jgi:hypothetical protein
MLLVDHAESSTQFRQRLFMLSHNTPRVYSTTSSGNAASAMSSLRAEMPSRTTYNALKHLANASSSLEQKTFNINAHLDLFGAVFVGVDWLDVDECREPLDRVQAAEWHRNMSARHMSIARVDSNQRGARQSRNSFTEMSDCRHRTSRANLHTARRCVRERGRRTTHTTPNTRQTYIAILKFCFFAAASHASNRSSCLSVLSLMNDQSENIITFGLANPAHQRVSATVSKELNRTDLGKADISVATNDLL